MKILGIDIGTTSISAVVIEGGKALCTRTVESCAFLPSAHEWERIQDVPKIISTALQLSDTLLADHPDVGSIGITGQQHGILYLDAEGNALSPLYTWQDGRGNLPFSEGTSFAAHLTALSGRNLYSGYGAVTHFYNVRNGLVPQGAVSFCTIHDYLAMVMCGLKSPLTDASDAASLGFFDVSKGVYDLDAIGRAGLDPAMFPHLAESRFIGLWKGRRVAVPIGDNQASFLGTAGRKPGNMLVNIGTGSQFSALSASYLEVDGLETRPFPEGGYLVVGASLCGGRAYALLDSFFCEAVEMATGARPAHCYDAMAEAAEQDASEDGDPIAETLFQGTRRDPSLRASISGLSATNFTPGALVRSVLKGIASELHGMALSYSGGGGVQGDLYGSGNALRKNPLLQEQLETMFGRKMTLSDALEEAALGAAVFASYGNNTQ